MPFDAQISDAEQTVWAFFVSQSTYIEKKVYEVKYPDIRYPGLVPVDTSAPKWVQTVTYFSQDRTGQANWLAGNAQDVPLVELTRQAQATTVHMAGIGYGFNEEELANAAALGLNLPDDKAKVARRASEEFIDRVVLFGDVTNGLTGLVNQTQNVTIVSAPAVGAGASALWYDKTPQQIMDDINGALLGIFIGTLTVEMADTILLPLAAWSYLSTTQLSPLSETTLLDYVMKKNAYTAETGRPLKMRGLRGLENAGTGGLGRMVAYRNDEDVVKFHMPMPFEFMLPWRKGPMRYEVPGRFRLGGVDVKRPGSFRYVDGISDATGLIP